MSPAAAKGLQASSHTCTVTVTTTPENKKSTHRPTPPPKTPPMPVKAFYRIAKLDRHEMERRRSSGHCTYCNETGHSRRSCAAGRMMRKVPKRELDHRLRSSVCPLCGDPDADGHSKVTCPQRQELQAAIASKEEAFQKSKAAAEAFAAEAVAKTSASDPIRRQNRRDTQDRHDRHIPVADTVHTNRKTMAPLPKYTAKKKTTAKTTPRKTVTTPPVAEQQDLIDFGSTLDDAPSNISSSVPGGDTRMGATHMNLLDTEVTEVVWDNILILPFVGAYSEADTEMFTEEEDLIDLEQE